MIRILLLGILGIAIAYPVEAVDVNSNLCSECEQIVGAVKLVISSNETEGVILNTMNRFCKMISAEYSAACTEIVSKYGEELLDALENYLSHPSQFCNLAGMCKPTSTSQLEAYEYFRQMTQEYASKGVEIFNHPTLQGSAGCELCEFFMDLVQSTLSDKPMVEFSLDEVLKLCQFLPSADVQECVTLVTSIEPAIYNAVVKRFFNPVTFCTGVDVCPSSNQNNKFIKL